ncbi:MAG: cell division protein PerM [Angustibacter sp.]
MDRLRSDARTSRAALRVPGAWSSMIRTAPARPDGPAEPVGVVTAVLAGAWTATLTWIAVVLPALFAWALAPQASASWSQAVRIATDIWLVVHRVQVDVPGGRVALAPLAALAGVCWVCWRSGQRIGAALPPGHQRRPGARGVLRLAGPTIAGLSAGYGAALCLGTVVGRGGDVRPQWWQAVLAGCVWCGGAAVFGVLRGAGVPVAAALAGAAWLPARVRRVARPAAAVALVLIGFGAVLVVVAVLANLGQVLTLYAALDAGVVGVVVLTVAQLAVLPNLALWGVAFVAGPGFAVGAGTAVGPAGSSVGLLPLVPVLGALPQPGPLPDAWMTVVVVPVLAGAVAGWWVESRAVAQRPDGRRRSPAGSAARPRIAGGRRWRDVVADAACCSALAAGILAVALWLSGGAAGPGRLVTVGPSAWRVGLILAAELTVGTVIGAWVRHRARSPHQ